MRAFFGDEYRGHRKIKCFGDRLRRELERVRKIERFVAAPNGKMVMSEKEEEEEEAHERKCATESDEVS